MSTIPISTSLSRRRFISLAGPPSKPTPPQPIQPNKILRELCDFHAARENQYARLLQRKNILSVLTWGLLGLVVPFVYATHVARNDHHSRNHSRVNYPRRFALITLLSYFGIGIVETLPRQKDIQQRAREDTWHSQDVTETERRWNDKYGTQTALAIHTANMIMNDLWPNLGIVLKAIDTQRSSGNAPPQEWLDMERRCALLLDSIISGAPRNERPERVTTLAAELDVMVRTLTQDPTTLQR